MKGQNRNKVAFFWNPRIDYQLLGTHQASGIEIQMGRWAKTFVANGWKVYGVTEENEQYDVEGITFVPQRTSKLFAKLHLSILFEFFEDFNIIIKYKPDIILFRGASRKLYCLSIICQILKCKLCSFAASDVNYTPGKDTVDKSERNTKLYRKALQRIRYFVTQNEYQVTELKRNYGKNHICIPNIWIDPISTSNTSKKYDVIWVSHLRPLKRAEWLVWAAESMPHNRFLIVGGSYDEDYYTMIEGMCKRFPNIDFVGPKSEMEVNSLIDQSRVLVCTSEYEGFPNTFLQAWAKSVPIISTVDPSGTIESNNLGLCVKTQDDLLKALDRILNNETLYEEMTGIVHGYFKDNYDIQKRFAQLINYLQ